jgi:hypothetical protein
MDTPFPSSISGLLAERKPEALSYKKPWTAISVNRPFDDFIWRWGGILIAPVIFRLNLSYGCLTY